MALRAVLLLNIISDQVKEKQNMLLYAFRELVVYVFIISGF
jgi:hypothetical protein